MLGNTKNMFYIMFIPLQPPKHRTKSPASEPQLDGTASPTTVFLSEPKSDPDRNTIKRVDSDGYVVSGIQVMTTYTSSALSIPLFIFLPM